MPLQVSLKLSSQSKRWLKKYPKELPACNAKCRPPAFDSYVAKSCPMLKACKEFELKK